MGRREYKPISNEEFIRELNKPVNKEQIKKACAKYTGKIDQHIIDSFKLEGLWLTISNHDHTRSSFTTFLTKNIQWLIDAHLYKEKEKRAKRGRNCNASWKLSDEIFDETVGYMDTVDYIENTLKKYTNSRDTNIYLDKISGFKPKELAVKYGCSVKNIHRIIFACKKLLRANATRNGLSL